MLCLCQLDVQYRPFFAWGFQRFKDMYLRLGGMHALMSFAGAVGSLMAESGLSDILSEVFGGVPKMLSANVSCSTFTLYHLYGRTLLMSSSSSRRHYASLDALRPTATKYPNFHQYFCTDQIRRLPR